MFELEIKTGNAAFQDSNVGNEVARILRELADLVQGATGIDDFQTAILRDRNGNRVGRATLDHEDVGD